MHGFISLPEATSYDKYVIFLTFPPVTSILISYKFLSFVEGNGIAVRLLGFCFLFFKNFSFNTLFHILYSKLLIVIEAMT